MRVVAVESRKDVRQLRAAHAQAWKEQVGLLGMMNALRELVDVEEHRPECVVVEAKLAPSALADEQLEPTQHCRQDGVLFADDS